MRISDWSSDVCSADLYSYVNLGLYRGEPAQLPFFIKTRILIRLENIRKTYESPGRVSHALAGVDLHIRQGEVFGIIGRSGAGKSTLIRMLNLLERPTQGRSWVREQYNT